MNIIKPLKSIGLAIALSVSLSPAVWADDDHDVEGRIQSIDPQNGSFVVKGKTYHTDGRTDYDDDLNSFSDLRVGQKVEVDYVIRNGRRLAKEIELDD
ncbi:MAG: DUF5666 domain-containing protein [Burkholderiaceae bacterium]